MRFRKRVKIAKGLNLNVSKSGLSLSAGGKGLSTTVGTKGAYVNYGIPGTGVYNRKKLSISSKNKNNRQNVRGEQFEIQFKRENPPSGRINSNYMFIKHILLKMNDGGEIEILDLNDNAIIDQSLLRKIKKSQGFKEQAEVLKLNFLKEINDKNELFINIHHLTPNLKSEKDWLDEYNSLKSTSYVERIFDIQPPVLDKSKQKLEEITKNEVKSLLFWTNKNKREKYIEENLHIFHQKEMDKWQNSKDKFLLEDIQRKTEIETNNKEIENLKFKIQNEILTGNPDYINQEMDNILSSLELPIEFSINFECLESDKVKLNIDLPMIEDLPDKQANLLKSGKLSIKQKTKKQIHQDYAKCIHGLAFFFGGIIFNISPKIDSIETNGYIQGLSSKTGNIEDQKLFFVEFNREKFSKLDVQKLDPIIGLENFNHNRKLLKSFEMKSI